MVNIIGGDYSGAQTDRNTCVVTGTLKCGQLHLELSCWVTRGTLAAMLETMAGTTVAAIDFPFSVPQEFAKHWNPNAQRMTDLWKQAAGMTYEDFKEVRAEFFAKQKREPKRCTDRVSPRAQSPIHAGRPTMLPMTFYGMQLLHRISVTGGAGSTVLIPPLSHPVRGCGKPGLVLMETMPGAVLGNLDLPNSGYKNAQATDLRKSILCRFLKSVPLEVVLSPTLKADCISHDDVLDAVVAAAVAAVRTARPSYLHGPPIPRVAGRAQIELEGWIYTIRKVPKSGTLC